MKNPIVLKPSADPWVVFAGGCYWYCRSKKGGVYIVRTDELKDIGAYEGQSVWCPPSGTEYSCELWAPELHYLMGRWYIYVACDDGKNENHRMYVLQGGKNPDNPLESEYVFLGKLTDTNDKWAIDGTVLQINEQLYFVWSGWEGNVDVGQNLYIATMSTPYEISCERVLLAVPEYEWEKRVLALLEGPVALYRRNRIFIVYSASASWTWHYCLGMLELIGNDPLNPNHWKKYPEPVFQSSEKNRSFGVGHNSFVQSPDGSEDWIVYHGMTGGKGSENRDVRAQKFGWTDDGFPVFGEPVPVDILS